MSISGGAGGTQQQQVNIKDPWVGAAPYLSNIMQQGASLYGSGAGSQLWQGPTVAPLNATMGEALNSTENLARRAAETNGLPYGQALNSIQNSGVTGAMGMPLGVMGNVATGGNAINTGGLYGTLANRAQTGASDNADVWNQLGPLLSGGGIGTANAFGDVANRAINNNSGLMGPIGDIASGANGINVNPQIQGLFNNSQDQNTASRSTLGRISQGADSIGTGGQFRSVSDAAAGPTFSQENLNRMASGGDVGKNPYLMQMLDANAARIGNRVDSAMSGAGRYGSFGHGDALARTINETNLPLLGQAYEGDMGRMLSANSQIDAARRAADTTRLAGISGETGTQAQNINNMMTGATGLANMRNADTALGSGLLGQMGGFQGQNIGNMLGAGGLAGNLNNANITNALSALSGQTGAQGQNAGLQLNAGGIIGGLRNSNFSNALSALGGQTGTQAQNISNQTGAAGGLLGGLQNSQGQAIQYAGLTPTLNSLMYDPAQRLAASGQYQQGRSQQEMDAQRQLFDQAQQMPWSQLSKYLGSVQGLGQITGQAGSTTSAGSGTQNLGLGSLLGMFGGGAGGGASAASGLANAGSAALSGAQAAGSAGLEALAAIFSDRDAKTDIKKLGVSPATGLDIYAYRYKGDPKTYPKVIGPMAQDIEEKYPGSTGLLDDKMFVKPHAMHLLKA